jgi:hypothetical protein
MAGTDLKPPFPPTAFELLVRQSDASPPDPTINNASEQ